MISSSNRTARPTTCQFQRADSVGFSAFSSEQIAYLSALEITEATLYENGKPTRGGLLDARLGISCLDQVCQTCREVAGCQGHIGHIHLNHPIMHYGYLETVAEVLESICHHCMRLRRSKDPKIKTKIKEIRKNATPDRRLKLMSKLLRGIKKCFQTPEEEDIFDKNYKPCGHQIPTNIAVHNYKLCFKDRSGKISYFDRQQIFRILSGFSDFKAQCEALGFYQLKPINLIIQNLVVPPPQIRPFVVSNGEKKYQDDLTIAYLKIITLNNQLKLPNTTFLEKNTIVESMENYVGKIMIEMRKKMIPKMSSKKQIEIKSISERLKGKFGRFRQNLLGKRVDFSARSVISPDPNLGLNELGVPQKIAESLTYPEKVTSLNYNKIISLCLEKKVKTLINPENDHTIGQQKLINITKLEATTREQMMAYVDYGMVAERVLQDGDIVLLNRQPTLHRMSMMAHRIKVLPYNTFRINLSVCSSYNADFDGDQMNMHVPQSYESLSELKNISSVENQIVGPKNGTTTMGFSQDSLLGVYLLSSRETFLTLEEVYNLLLEISDGWTQSVMQRLPQPAILAPCQLWTGKQLISMIFPPELSVCALRARNKSDGFSDPLEKSLIIRNGELLSGCLGKQTIGSSSSYNNIIHWMWIEKSPSFCQNFVSSLQRVVYKWFTGYGFSIGAADVVPDAQMMKYKGRQDMELKVIYYKVLNQFRSKQAIKKNHLHQHGRLLMDSFELNINSQLNNRLSKAQEIVKATLNSAKNNIYRIVQAKSKGSETNLTQILFTVGNQNIDGRRCPLGFGRRALPHFNKDDYSPAARGYVGSSFFQGLRPDQFFFHSMGGRQGLSDTAIKTSKVGYLQRKIIKSLQDLIVKYDGSVRDSQNNLVQNCYGEDGFCSEFIEKHTFEAGQLPPTEFQEAYKWSEAELRNSFSYGKPQLAFMDREYTDLYHCKKSYNQVFLASRQYYCPINIPRIIGMVATASKREAQYSQSKKNELQPIHIVVAVNKLLGQCLPPTLKYIEHIRNSNSQASEGDGSGQRRGEFQVFRAHVKLNLSSKILIKQFKMTEPTFRKLLQRIKSKYFQALAPAGQSVGCLAAQSIGQPTTQMTLNTFHLAGISESNVTLGLPRIEQLLSCTRDIKSEACISLYLKQPIPFSSINSPGCQPFLLHMIMHELPFRKVDDFILSTKLHYCPSPQQQMAIKEAPYILEVNFDKNKITSGTVWKNIVEKLEKSLDRKTTIVEADEFQELQQQQPRVNVRCMLPGLAAEQKLLKTMAKLQEQVKNVVVGGIPGIKSVKLSKDSVYDQGARQNKEYVLLEAYGSNLLECLRHPAIDQHKSYSNNVWEISSVLGIEAARKALLNEFKQVLKPYGISVNYRHLSVLVDWMCQQGQLTPANRAGIHRLSSISVLTKASFEQSSHIMFKAAAHGCKDQIKDATQRIIFGQPTLCGTAQSQILIDPEKVKLFTHRQQQTTRTTTSNQILPKLLNTPKLEESISYVNSFYKFGSRKLNNSVISTSPFGTRSPGLASPFAMRSPGLVCSPILPFSPTYDSRLAYEYRYDSSGRDLISSNFRNLSPSYNLSPRVRTSSPAYDRQLQRVEEIHKKEQQNAEETSVMQERPDDDDEF